MDSATFTGGLALIGAVIIVAGLLSGLIERTNLPQVAAFLLLGLGIGPHGLGLMDIGLDSPFLRAVSTIGLALLLFIDAVTLDVSEIRRHWKLATLILGPGTLLVVAALSAAGKGLLGLGWPESVALAAAVSSTDPVILRSLFHRRDLSARTRLALRLESGLNDIVLLPILLAAMLFFPGTQSRDVSMATLGFQLFLLGPIAGCAVGFAAIWLLRAARSRVGVRRDYESMYSLGVCFAAYASAEAMHGSGFLACFAAGMIIAVADPELCDCFVEYGETTAELLLMFTFVLLGGSLIWTGLSGMTIALAAFVFLALFARSFALYPALSLMGLDRASKLTIAWFGPRGLSTLLLILLVVFAALPGSERLFQICALIVLASIVVHGGSITALGRKRPSGQSPHLRVTDPVLLNIDEIDTLRASGADVVLVDVRSSRAYESSPDEIEGALRFDPENPARTAASSGIEKDAWPALFCT